MCIRDSANAIPGYSFDLAVVLVKLLLEIIDACLLYTSLSVPSSFLLHLPQQLHDPLPVLCGFHECGEMVGLGLFRASRWLFPQVGAEIADQIGKVLPVECPDWLTLEGGQKPKFQVEVR